MVIDPVTETIWIYRDRSSIEVLHRGDTVDANPIVGGWHFKISEVFGELAT
ncbi:MAG: hypothetical protein KDA99_27590 [Planctomycetales bacterium]|nr:hypothetical protein [Planctomycetales bacterium]